jgi:uncharacterized phage protein gp47/JayE
MPIEIKTIQQNEQVLTNALIKSINTGQSDPSKKVDPTIRNSFLRGVIQSLALGIYENNKNIQKGITEAFLGGDSWREFWASKIGINTQDATTSNGNIVLTGTAGTLISAGTLITNANSIQYSTNANVTIANQTINISSVTRAGTQVTVSTVDNHNLANNVAVSILGANESEYNVSDQIIAVTGLKTFTFDIASTPSTPATGTLTLNFTNAVANVTSTTLGANTNIGSIIELTLVNAIINVNPSVFTTFDGISGGLDVESDLSVENRVSEKFQSYFSAPFTKVGIPIFLKEAVAGITRTWVKDAYPTAGKVTIYFVRDNDVNILPNSTQINDAKNAIINGTDKLSTIKPSNTPDSYVIVLAPTPVTVNFIFTSVTPNTDAMKQAIKDNLIDFFKNNTDFETSITRDELFNIILQTTDNNGNTPKVAIGLTDIIIGFGEIPILGTVEF